MTSSRPTVTRRALLAALTLAPLAGCTTQGTTAAPSTPAPGPVPTTVSPTTAAGEQHGQLDELERRFDARLGVYALATGTGATIAHRADERFAFCSAFTGLAAAAVLHANPLTHLDQTRVTYTTADLMRSSKITRPHVDAGMTLREVCSAAVRHSDGTAANLLLADIGGPARLTSYLRGLGDAVTLAERTEPAITEAVPGDLRDTTSPRAIGEDYRKLVLGDALPPDERAFLRDLLEHNETLAGERRVRAGVPEGWTVASKTGTGSYGTTNDITIVSPSDSPPLVIAIMSSKATKDSRGDDALLAAAAEYVVATLT